MNQDAVRFVNGLILRQANKLTYRVADLAPSTEVELFTTPSLVIWSGASEGTIYGDAAVNWAFRALHDTLHLRTRMDFSVDAEIELGRIQASQYDSDLMRELVFAEVSLQAAYFKKHGTFVPDQAAFTMAHLEKMGVL